MGSTDNYSAARATAASATASARACRHGPAQPDRRSRRHESRRYRFAAPCAGPSCSSFRTRRAGSRSTRTLAISATPFARKRRSAKLQIRAHGGRVHHDFRHHAFSVTCFPLRVFRSRVFRDRQPASTQRAHASAQRIHLGKAKFATMPSRRCGCDCRGRNKRSAGGW